jgi:hypothetical protein
MDSKSVPSPYGDISNPHSILCKAAPEHAISAASLSLGFDMGNIEDDLMHSGEIVMATHDVSKGNQQRSFEKESDLLVAFYGQSVRCA